MYGSCPHAVGNSDPCCRRSYWGLGTSCKVRSRVLTTNVVTTDQFSGLAPPNYSIYSDSILLPLLFLWGEVDYNSIMSISLCVYSFCDFWVSWYIFLSFGILQITYSGCHSVFVFPSFEMDYRLKIRTGNDTSSSYYRVLKIHIIMDLERHTASVNYDTWRPREMYVLPENYCRLVRGDMYFGRQMSAFCWTYCLHI